ncbi:MAG: EAL domain-containing protein [Acidobacteriota bacterium]|nr:EAL domain-containing protein [Acidobacteriota bacterium]MDH3784387.1 EAL domain-containing protein [Acidobacteriota bacterium]
MDYRREFLRLRGVTHDRTTDLPVYAVLIDRFRGLLDKRRSLGLLHVGLGELSTVESLYGWQVYDKVVTVAAAALRESIADSLADGALLAIDHAGGCGFVVVVWDENERSEWTTERLSSGAQALRAAVSGALAGHGLDRLNPSPQVQAGHARLSQNPFYRFERRLQHAVAEAAAMDARVERRRESSWSEALDQIISRAAVETLFQPVVDLKNRAVLGWEAFSRGPHDSELESPRRMFAVSKRMGRSGDLDRLCRETALRASAEMVGRGKIFVNALAHAEDAEGWETEGDLFRQLEAISLQPEDLVLEFSERGADTNGDHFVEVLRNVQDQGYAVALDDIGTGYAGRELLERIRPQYMKLDVSLVRDVHENLIKQELLSTIVDLSHSIGAEVIAEGVECREEVDTLIDSGARFGQGYLFAEPAPPAAAFQGGQLPANH